LNPIIKIKMAIDNMRTEVSSMRISLER